MNADPSILAPLLGRFFERHPGEAARVLERLTPQQVADTLVLHPRSTAARVLVALGSADAARVLGCLPTATAVEFLEPLDPAVVARGLVESRFRTARGTAGCTRRRASR